MDQVELITYILESVMDNSSDEEFNEVWYKSLIVSLNKYGFRQWDDIKGIDPLFDEILHEKLGK